MTAQSECYFCKIDNILLHDTKITQIKNVCKWNAIIIMNIYLSMLVNMKGKQLHFVIAVKNVQKELLLVLFILIMKILLNILLDS